MKSRRRALNRAVNNGRNHAKEPAAKKLSKKKAPASVVDRWPFAPIEIRGEPLSATILKERRQ